MSKRGNTKIELRKLTHAAHQTFRVPAGYDLKQGLNEVLQVQSVYNIDQKNVTR